MTISMVGMWLIVAVLAVIAEACTAQLVAIWFAPAALVALVASWCGMPVVGQVILFVAVSALLIVFLYRKLRRNIADKCEKTNLDALVGAKAKVEEAIPADGYGRVKIRGVSWKAYCKEAADVGETLNVESIDGVTLICRKAD